MVRLAAAHALAALPPAPEIMAPIWEKAFQDADEKTVDLALDAVATLGPPAVPKLVHALKYPKVRLHVLSVLGKIGPAAAPATAAVTELIADKDDEVAYEAMMTLAKIGPGAKAAVPELLKVARHPATSRTCRRRPTPWAGSAPTRRRPCPPCTAC